MVRKKSRIDHSALSSCGLLESTRRNDKQYARFEDAVKRLLESFGEVNEWHDFTAFLVRFQKVRRETCEVLVLIEKLTLRSPRHFKMEEM